MKIDRLRTKLDRTRVAKTPEEALPPLESIAAYPKKSRRSQPR
jgi:hypothetical protein